jgi:hypothetical protein
VSRLEGAPSSRLATATAAKTGSLVPIDIDGVQVQVQCARDLAPAAGDVLTLSRFGGLWVATGRVYAAAVAMGSSGAVGPNPNALGTAGTLTVPPVETRSYRSTGWRTDTTQTIQGEYQGNGNHTGCAFYGPSPRSLAGAVVTSASVAVRRAGGGAYGASSTTLRLVTQSTRPGGAPTLTSTTAGPSLPINTQHLTFPVPAAWVQAMVDGTAGGLAVFVGGGSPYVRLDGIREWGPAWTLTINWSR